MAYQVEVTLRFVPGKAPFEIIPDTAIQLTKYGWVKVGFDLDRTRFSIPLRTAADVPVTYTLEGKKGATSGEAAEDVQAALKNTPLWQLVVGRVATKIAQAPVAAARLAGESTGAALNGAVSKAGIGVSVAAVVTGLLALAVVVGVGVVAFKKA